MSVLDLASHPSWHWHGKPDPWGIDDNLIRRKDARMNGGILRRAHICKRREG